ncbi:MAG: GspH/FimT family pseudopilin [Pseudomonadota bacterium]
MAAVLEQVLQNDGPAHASQPSAAAGYTLIEMLVAMLIIVLLGTYVGPSFLDAINRNRQQSALGDVFAMLGTARSEAVTRAVSVVACASTDADACSGSNWEDGWIVFADDGNGGGTADDGDRQSNEPLIRVGQEVGGGVTVRTRNLTTAGVISFDLNGMTDERGTFVICRDDPTEASGVVLNLSGQARMAVDQSTPENQLIEADDGTEVSACP